MLLPISEFYRGKRVLITGHTGFIGSWLTKCLEMMGAEICGCSLDPPTTPNMFDALKIGNKIKDLRVDVRDRKLLYNTVLEFQPEITFHLSAQPLVLLSYDNPVETFETNVLGTVNLLDSLREISSVKAIIVVTSDKTYKGNRRTHTYVETDPLGGKDPYSASKSCEDIIVDSFRQSYFSEMGIGISSVRAGNVIGGGDWARNRIVPDLVKGIVNNEVVKIRNPNSTRPWQFVLEPISGMLLLAERMFGSLKYSGAWNFGPDNSQMMTVRDLADKFIECWGSGNYIVQQSIDTKEAMHLKLNASKAKRELGWSPKYSNDTIIEKTVSWYKSYYQKGNAEVVTTMQIGSYFYS